jgi:site-specific DNA-methyltransferase (adenine-specific)
LSIKRGDIKSKSKVTKEEWRDFTKTVWDIANIRHDIHPAMFPPEIPHRLTKLFSFYGETVLDPFSGIGTTGKACLPLGRKFIGFDTNKRYLGIAKRSLQEISKNGFQLRQGDSKDMGFIGDSTIGLIVTSPPYWNKADYGKAKGNLGSITNYRQFLDGIKPIFMECYRVLMPGRKMCVVTANVNQNTSEGLLTFPIASDYIQLCRDMGFLLVSEVIWNKNGTGGKWGSFGAQRPIFGSYPYPPNFLFKNIHEHIIIFKKPDNKKKKVTEGIPDYHKLMGIQ